MATKIWGPLGWLTLHSVSAIYPDNPTPEEKQIVRTFLELFRNTITCRFCKEHFSNMYISYSAMHPEFLDSRRDFFLFIARAHNTVNKRLDKPRPESVKDCLEVLKTATKVRSSAEYRKAYIQYLIRDWSKEFSGDGAIAKRDAQEMQKINEHYWDKRDKGFDGVLIWEGNVLEIVPEASTRLTHSGFVKSIIPAGPVGFHGGKLRLRR